MAKNKKRSGVRKFIYLLIFIIIVVVAIYFYYNNVGKTARIYVDDYIVVLDSTNHGTYMGVYEAWPGITAASVSFSVDSGKLVQFDVIKVFTIMGGGVEDSIASVVEESGELDFDAISGATHSSYFIKAAIKNAFGEE